MSRPTTVPPADWDGLDLDLLTDVQRRVFWAGYFLGWQHGVDRGREQADAEAAEVWADVATRVQKLGSPQSVPYSVLCERRGQPERAERARANEARVMSQ